MIEIRKATPADIPEIARVHVESDWHTYAPLFGAQAYMLGVGESEQRWRQALQDDGLLLVATDSGAIVGLGHACGDRVAALYLSTAYHRQGIGGAIFARLLQFLNERGVLEARLEVVTVNAAAIAFYRAQGARPVGRRINRDPRGDTEDLVMAIATVRASPT